MKKQKIATVITCCALVGVVAVGGTLALLTSESQTLKNTFTVGAGYGDDDFLLKEHGVDQIVNDAAVVPGYKVGDYVMNTDVVHGVTGEPSEGNGNDYDDVIPNSKLDKDPWFELATGAPASWIVAAIDKTELQNLSNAGITVDVVPNDTNWYVVTGGTGTWQIDHKVTKNDFAGGTGTLYLIYNEALQSGESTDALFTQLKAGTTVSNITDSPLNIKGVAVQALDDVTVPGDVIEAIMTDATGVLA
ncbi:MAG: hypothetical protein MR743_05280 [Oscillospiraceae bacterium]|nr:hypothetical protein [Oscillospiraceae bacterium]MCI7639785.1 hypothetical protein [Clostridiales bacterium]